MPRRHRHNAFTLVEILIVVMILAILASIVVPRYSTVTDEGRRAAIADQLRIFRDSVALYTAEHNERRPGTSAAVPAGSVALLISQLTTYTDIAGNTSATKDATHKFGPYLPVMPANPISELSTVKLDSTTAAVPTADDTTGWIYQPATGRVSINLGATDGAGKTYVNY